MLGFLIDLGLFAAAVTYAVKYYKFKNMAEKEFINYQSQLEDQESKIKEEAYIHESEVHLQKEENGELKPEIEGRRIELKRLKDKANANSENIAVIIDRLEEMQNSNVQVVKKVAASLYKKINQDLKDYLGK